MVYLSKSKYCGLWQCPKIAWLRKYMPEKAIFDSSVLARMEAGNVVGDLAMGLFGDFVEVTAYEGDKLDLVKMIDDTKTEMEKGTDNICEASFSYNGLYCAAGRSTKSKAPRSTRKTTGPGKTIKRSISQISPIRNMSWNTAALMLQEHIWCA